MDIKGDYWWWMVIFPGEFYGIILRCHQTCKPGKKTRGLNGGFPAVVGKNSSKNGGNSMEFLLPCLMTPERKKGDFQWFEGAKCCLLAQFFSFSVAQLPSWGSDAANVGEGVAGVWLFCGSPGSHGSGDWPTMWVKKTWNPHPVIPFTAKIAGSRWSSPHNMVSIGDQSPCQKWCFLVVHMMVRDADPHSPHRIQDGFLMVSCYTIFDRDRGS